jgi:mannose-1-phosphate guanylyltransferase/phosphomannomutase
VLTPDQTMLALVVLLSEAHPGAVIALPVNTTSAATALATERGARVVPTRLADAHIMEVASAGGVSLAASGTGAFIWPDFLGAYDGLVTLGHVLDLLAATGRALSDVVAALPPVHVAHETLATPWDRRGAVMRELVEHVDPDEVVLVDGVKLLGDSEWMLVRPDPVEPVTHVWAEAATEARADQIVAETIRRIRDILR